MHQLHQPSTITWSFNYKLSKSSKKNYQHSSQNGVCAAALADKRKG